MLQAVAGAKGMHMGVLGGSGMGVKVALLLGAEIYFRAKWRGNFPWNLIQKEDFEVVQSIL